MDKDVEDSDEFRDRVATIRAGAAIELIVDELRRPRRNWGKVRLLSRRLLEIADLMHRGLDLDSNEPPDLDDY
ncbi:MAG: hypothetical protein J2O48_04845 [Solirubrobacterales bacterium]|nr:hypothetical protein [Solirubrobacterales bacterium]